jgi:ATP/maltotriose-dependent transcriptional regulator MalT/two-component SAPR family response regulator
MPVRIIEKKLKEPAVPSPTGRHLYIPRQKFFSAVKNELDKNKRFLFIQGISGYGKTAAVQSFFSENGLNEQTLWYSLDEWDKDPVTFLNYIYFAFKRKLGNLPEALEEYFSQPLNSEKILKTFIGQLSNELESRLENEMFLVLDNFQEIQNEEIILKIITFLFNYCPEKLNIFFISNNPLPEAFYPFYLKHELYEFNNELLFLEEQEAGSIFSLLNIPRQKLLKEFLVTSNKSISLFILLARNAAENPDFLNNYRENKIYKNAIKEITQQIYKSFSAGQQVFILETLLLPKITISILKEQISEDTVRQMLESLKKHGLIYQDEEKEEFFYNQSFAPALEEIFFSLPENEKEIILENTLKFLEKEPPESIIPILLKAKSFERMLNLLLENYEYYFRNYLYETLAIILNELIKYYQDNIFIIYLQIRLKRTTGQISQALEQIGQIAQDARNDLILLEEGICEASLGHFKDAINKLKALEARQNFPVKDQLTLINGLGISYLHNHQLALALNNFNQAIALKNTLVYNSPKGVPDSGYGMKHDLIKIYHNLGLAYTWQGEFDKAIESYEQSLYLSKQLKVLPLAMTFNNLSIIHNLQGNYQKAYQGCLEGLEIVRKLKNYNDEIFLNLTLTEAYRGLKNMYKEEECLRTLDQLLSITPNTILDALLLKQKAYYSLDKGEPEKALELLLQGIHIRRLSEGDPSFIEYKMELAIINFHRGKWELVIKSLTEIEEEVKKGEHKYHLARLYVYKALSFFKLTDQKNYEAYRQLSGELISKYNYPLLREKLGMPVIKSEDVIPAENLETQLKINTFGEMDVSFDSQVIAKKEWSGKKTKLLFLYLLLNKPGVSKEQILNALFPEGDRSRSALHVLINRLRKALAGLFKNKNVDLILFSDDLYKFNSSVNYWWDTERFGYLVREAAGRQSPDNITLLERALGLYRDHFMQGFELEDWVFTEQEYYKKTAYKTYEQVCSYYFSQNDFEKILALSSHFFRIDNCFEKACENKMKALIGLNRKNDALKQYDILVNSLNKVLNEKPSKEIQLYRQLLIKN